MEPQGTENVIIISPKNAYLSPEELVACRDSTAMPAFGDASTSSAEISEDEELANLYSILRLSISSPRIERLGGRSLAIWDAEKGMARVVRKDGKFDTFGTTYDQQVYLEYFEALYLLESGRLQLEHHARILSIEQAYLLLLGEAVSKKYSEYFVYAHLTRTGYILKRYKNKYYHRNTQPTETDCVWAWLHNEVERKPVPSHIKKTQIYANLKRQVGAIKGSIIEQRQPVETSIYVDTEETPTSSIRHKGTAKRKRKQDDILSDCNSKFVCACGNSFLDFMTNAPEYKKFNETFQKFDLVKIKSTRRAENDNMYSDDDKGYRVGTSESADNALVISFDMYLHNRGFKKSLPELPLMRVIVLRSFESFPNYSQISLCSQSMLHTTPVLTVSVGDAKQFQAFLYFFT